MSRFLKDSVIIFFKIFIQLVKIDVILDDNSKLSKVVDIGIIIKREVDGLRKNKKIIQGEQR